MSKGPPAPYENRVVAFIDILGFRALVAKLPTDPALHRLLHRALDQIKSYASAAGQKGTAQERLESSVFSDSIVISGPEDALATVIWTCTMLQSKLLAGSILTRGGISFGPTHHKAGLLYGDGMIRAYDLESKAAVYPRVLIDPILVEKLQSFQRATLLSRDVDGLWHTDPFSVGVSTANDAALLEDGHDPHFVFLELFTKLVDQRITEARDAGILAKWGWMKSKVQEALEYHKAYGKARFWHALQIAKDMSKDDAVFG